jgi:antitoxin MazE
MKARVIKIGNSKGIRLPKAILEQVGLGEEVVLEASRGALVIRPASKPRATWGASFQEMAKHGDDRLLDIEISGSSWDKEWEWK